MSIKGTVTSLSEDQWDRILDVNLKSVYLFSHLVIPIMAKQGGGVIINTGSVTSLVGVRDFAAYVASKSGMIGLTRAMALDHAREKVRVNCICPGGIMTPLMEWQIKIAPDPALEQKRIYDLHPIGRVAKPEEIAHLYVYLASDEASYITGASFPFDGGYTAQ
jgi:NAD(P)-dependent dehydrogenase (short-subunit alcohol dehydrogenase family)